jgi:CheY-like chemotaxis protein
MQSRDYRWIQGFSNVVCVLNMSGEVVEFNEKASSLFGDTGLVNGEVVSLHPVHPTALNLFLENKEEYCRLYSIQNAAGIILPFDGSVSLITSPEGVKQLLLQGVMNGSDSRDSGLSINTIFADFQEIILGMIRPSVINDIRGNLTIISGYAEFAQDDLPEESEGKVDLKEIVKICTLNQKKLAKLTRTHKKTKDIQSIYFNAHTWLIDVVETINTFVSGKRVGYNREAGPYEATLYADPVILEEIFFGIIVIMADLQGGGEVHFNTFVNGSEKLSDISSAKDEQQFLKICVHTNDFEIKKERDFIKLATLSETIVKVFDGYQQIKCKGNFVEFSIFLPISEKPPSHKPTDKGPPMGKGQRVLVVDDEPSVAEITCSRLRRLGYKAKKMTESTDVYQHFVENRDRYDILITDQVMPGKTGLEIIEEVHSIRKDLPVVMMTGYSSGITPDICRENGINYLLMKPVDSRELAVIIAKALENK